MPSVTFRDFSSFIFNSYLLLSLCCTVWFLHSYLIYKKYSPSRLRDGNHNSKYNFCQRLDHHQISFFYSLIGSFFFCPIRVIVFVIVTIIVLWTLLILKTFASIFPWVRNFFFYEYIHLIIVKFIGAFTLRVLGVMEINNYVIESFRKDEHSNLLNYSFVVSSGPPSMSDVITIVSNHISILDISFFMRYVTCGFVARKEIHSNYIFGTVADIIGCIYVDRSCIETRSYAKELIQKRQLQRLKYISSTNIKNELVCKPKSLFLSYASFFYNKIKDYMNFAKDKPLIIFPEGTTSNGINIIPFKTGAFESLVPIQPVVLLYNYSAYSPAFDILPFWVLINLLFCSYGKISLSAFWLPQMHPNSMETVELTSKKYTQNVRNVMSQVLEKVREKVDFSCEFKGKKLTPINMYRNDSRKRFNIFVDGNKEYDNSNSFGSLRIKREYIEMLKNI